MATQSGTKVNLSITVDETKSNDLGLSNMLHVWQKIAEYADGTSSNQSDLVYSDSATIAGSGGTTTYDLSGALTSILDGSAVVFSNIVGFAVINKTLITTSDIEIGAGSNPWTGWLKASGDAVVVGPGGVFVWTSPIDGGAVVATTGDILTLTNNSASNIDVDLIVWGRSA